MKIIVYLTPLTVITVMIYNEQDVIMTISTYT